jgi:hypothetical protein
MHIPTDALERQTLYLELARLCSISRDERFTFYQQLRNFYLFGTPDSSGTEYNKIASTVETLCSFIYSPDSTRFSLHLGSAAPADDIVKVPSLVHEVNDQWRMGRTHLTFGVALRWALTFGCTLMKGMWKRGVFRTWLVEPHQFGVLREDVPLLSDQEAFVHHYTMTRTQLVSELHEHPKKDKLIPALSRGGSEGEKRLSESPMTRLILSAGVSLTSPTSQSGGAVAGGLLGAAGVSYDYSPKVETDLIDMMELYVWNDEIEDYQMVTIASPGVVIYDRRQPGVRGNPGFVKVSADNNLYDYFWGESFVAKLTRLQMWRTKRMGEISELLAKQVDPPLAFTGFGGIQEEKMAAMRAAGGRVSSAMPGAKVEDLSPTMPSNLFIEIDQIDKMFDDQAGIGHILQGKGESGVRSKGQADLMARLGSARPKSRALIVEEAAEDIATLLLRSVQDNSDQRFIVPEEKDSEGSPLSFLANQFTNDFEVRVDAHSSSPIFVEDRKADAYQLLEAHAIDRETLLELVDPPGVQLLKKRLKAIEVKEAEQARMQMAAQQGGQK